MSEGKNLSNVEIEDQKIIENKLAATDVAER